MPGMGRHTDLSKRQIKAVVAVVSVIAIGLAVYSAAASYDTVSLQAIKFGVSLPRLTPIGIDGGYLGLVIFNLALTWLKKPVWWLILLARFFAVAIVAANCAAGWPHPVGMGLRVAAPVLFITIVEGALYVLLHRSDEAEQERQRKRDERIPFARWVLSPKPTFFIWRRRTLWAGSRLPQSAIDTELSIIRLMDFYGPEWEQNADADLVWMIKAGVNMDEVLGRVRKLTSTGSGTGGSTGPGLDTSTEVGTGGVGGDETVTDDAWTELVKAAREYRDELAAAGLGERPTQKSLRLRFGVGSAKANKLLNVLKEDEQNEAPEATGAVG